MVNLVSRSASRSSRGAHRRGPSLPGSRGRRRTGRGRDRDRGQGWGLQKPLEGTTGWWKERMEFGGGKAEVEETLKRIQSHKGVLGTMVVNAEGIPIRTTLDNSTTVQYAGLLHQLTMKARSTIRDIDPQNDLTFLRIRSKKHEIMVAPDKEYLLIAIQNPC
ncbi:Dynein light chain roadblock-type 2 [Manis javanica]|nr:Dynein light chain roadblock-type 2 [Manis javanica]